MSDTSELDVITEDKGAPTSGWLPEDFPQLSVASIPYTSNANIRTDPTISVMDTGWIYVEVGQTRIAIPDEEEWGKLVNMVDRMIVTHKRLSFQSGTGDSPE
jgi:hypothetical protein